MWNFSAGPAQLPKTVLEQVHARLFNFQGCGCSILEMGHRTDEIRAVFATLEENLRTLLQIPRHFDLMFMQGGGRMQFAMVPMNFLQETGCAIYCVDGTWSKGAQERALRYGQIQTCSMGADPFARATAEHAYAYYCDNETIHGKRFACTPRKHGARGLVTDMSSNFLSRPIDWEEMGLVWAAAQKNFAPAGLTVGIVRRDWLNMAYSYTPTMMNYASYAYGHSMPNTPPVFQVYVAKLVTDWLLAEGGVERMDRRAKARSQLLYDVLDQYPDLYVHEVPRAFRSRMNVVFHLPNEELTQEFLSVARQNDLYYLEGHRSVGGIRASMYNAMPIEGARRLAFVMKEFAKKV